MLSRAGDIGPWLGVTGRVEREGEGGYRGLTHSRAPDTETACTV